MKRPAAPALVLRVAFFVFLSSVTLAQHLPSAASIGASAGSAARFTPNAGQVVDVDGARRPEIRYVAHGRGMSIYLADSRISYVFTRIEGDLERYRKSDGHSAGHHHEDAVEPVRHLHRIDLEFLGALPSPQITSELPSADVANYYLPHAPEGITGVRSFGRIVYRNLYRNIDFVIHGSGDRIKYDFVVHPGGRVSDIRMRYVGATGSEVESDGSLLTTTPLGNLREDAPYSYQERSSRKKGRAADRHVVSSSFRLSGDTLSFLLGRFDSTRTLVIDPTQKWSTYYGGQGTEDLFGGDATEVDRSGNCFFTGTTTSSTFPTAPGAFQSTVTADIDIVVVKMSIGGKRLWATIYGGSSTELAHGVATDRSRNVFVAGHTVSDDFPTYRAFDRSLGGIRDAFTIKFDSNGVRQWATYYGGDGFDDSYGFAIDSTGNPALVGTTESEDGSMATPGAFQQNHGGGVSDVFVVKFSSSGERLWGTYYGGSGIEQGHGAATDIHDNINITGWTNSMDFPVTAGSFQTELAGDYDAFVVRLNSSGTRQWGTFFGGSDTENDEEDVGVGSIATDGSGNPVITGATRSHDLPTSANALQPTFGGVRDAFIAMFDGAGRRLWSTYYGGSRDEVGNGIASSRGNGVLVTGHTYSRNFPGITADAFSSKNAGGADAFIVKLDSTGARREYVTFYGGAGDDFGLGISFDPFGSIVVAGNTASNDFPTTADAFQKSNHGSVDAFVALFCDMSGITITADGPTTFCHGDSVTLSAPAGYASYLWSSSSNGSVSTSRSITVADEEDYSVRVTNGAGCFVDSDPVAVRWKSRPDPVTIVAGGGAFLCPGDSVTLTATGDGNGVVYWSNGSIGRSIRVGDAGTYSAIIVDGESGCSSTTSNTIVVTTSPLPDVDITAAPSRWLCEGSAVTLDAGIFAKYRWRDSANNTLGSERTLTVARPGVYFVEVENEAGCSRLSQGITILSSQAPSPVITVDGEMPLLCNGGRLVLRAGRHARYLWIDESGTTLGTADTLLVEHPGLYTVTVDDGACSASVSIRIEGGMPIVPATSASGIVALCPGENMVITAEAGYAGYQWMRDGIDLPGETDRDIVVDLAGLYSVRVVETGGCSGVSATTRVSVYPGATRPLITAVEDGLVSTPASSYQWSRNGVAIPGATERILRNPGEGIFAVSITDSNGCKASSEHYRPGIASTTVGFGEHAAAPGERITIPLLLARSHNLTGSSVRGFTTRIRFNRTMLQPLGGFLSDSIDGEERILTVAASLPSALTGDSSALVSLDFTALLGNALSTPLVVEMFEWDSPGVTVFTFDGVFRTTDFCIGGGTRQMELAGKTRLSALLPNPAHGLTRIEFEVEEAGRTQISLIDMMGRSTEVLDAMLTPGVHAATFETADLASGTYYCILRTASQQRSQSLMIRK